MSQLLQKSKFVQFRLNFSLQKSKLYGNWQAELLAGISNSTTRSIKREKLSLPLIHTNYFATNFQAALKIISKFHRFGKPHQHPRTHNPIDLGNVSFFGGNGCKFKLGLLNHFCPVKRVSYRLLFSSWTHSKSVYLVWSGLLSRFTNLPQIIVLFVVQIRSTTWYKSAFCPTAPFFVLFYFYYNFNTDPVVLN